MRRRLAAVVAVVAVVLVTASAALAMTLRDDPPGDRDRGWGPMGMMRDGPGMPGRHSARVTSEYQFLVEMVAHHREAVAAARELRRSGRAEMRGFGESIVASQSAQIDQMEGWLDDWYADRSGRTDYEPMMRDLSGLSGDRLDRAFLQDMVGHHRAAVMMSQQLLVRGIADHPAVEALARTIRDEQHAEIVQMHRWSAEWFGEGRGGGWGHMDRRGSRMMR